MYKFLHIFLWLLRLFHRLAPMNTYNPVFRLKQQLSRFLCIVRYTKYSPASL
jgi:hypothetical protein